MVLRREQSKPLVDALEAWLRPARVGSGKIGAGESGWLKFEPTRRATGLAFKTSTTQGRKSLTR